MASKEGTIKEQEFEQHQNIPEVYYADDFSPSILSMISPLWDGEYVFELARKSDTLDNLGIGLKSNNVSPRDLGRYLRNRVERRIEEFNARVASLELQAARSLQIGDSQINVYSYRETSPNDFKGTAEALSIIVDRTPKSRFMPKNIILLPDLNVRTTMGTPANGETITELNTIQLYQIAFAEAKHRIPETSNLVGTVVHEWAH